MTSDANEGNDVASYPPVPPEILEHQEDVYRLAFEEGMRTLKYQDDEVDRLRDRVFRLLTINGAAAAFLAATVLREPPNDRSAVFFILVGVGTTAFVVLAVLTWRILRPIENWVIKVAPSTIVQSYGDAATSPSETFRELALHCDWAIEANEARIEPIRTDYRRSVVAVGVQVVVWIWAAWVFV